MIRFLPFLIVIAFFYSCSAESPFQNFYAQKYINEGNRFYGDEDYRKAMESFDKAVQLNPQGDLRYYSHYFRGLTSWRLGKFSAAIDDMGIALKVNPRSESPYLVRGNCYLNREQPEEARKDFEKVLALNPSNAGAHSGLGDFFRTQNSFQKAVDEYSRAITCDPEMDEAFRKRADLLASIDLLEIAISNYTRAIQLNPTNRLAFQGRAQANARIGRRLNFQLDDVTARELARQEAKRYWKAALRALGRNDTETALYMYRLSLEMDPSGSAGSGNPGDTWFDRGVVYLHDRQYEQALIDLRKTVSLNPKNWKAVSTLGICYFELGYFEMAGEQFRECLKNNPHDELAVYYLGRIENRMNRPEKAVELFTSAVTMEPKLLQAYNERADTYFAMEKFQKALSDYNHLLDRNWNDPTVLLKRGRTFDALSLYDDAVADYSEFIRMAPKTESPLGYLYRGNAFMGMKKYALANRDYSKYISTVMTNGPYDTNSVAEALTNMNKCFLVLVKRRKI